MHQSHASYSRLWARFSGTDMIVDWSPGRSYTIYGARVTGGGSGERWSSSRADAGPAVV
jgi:hypothetical protein